MKAQVHAGGRGKAGGIRLVSTPEVAEAAAAALGLQLCFVGLPLVLIGQGAAIDAGLFEKKHFDPHLLQSDRPVPKHIAPWL